MTDPLPRGQQILLQRMMAQHTMTDEQCNKLMQEIGDDEMGNVGNLAECFASINKELTKGFGLEIATMVASSNGEKYHAVINQHADVVAKQSYSHIIGLNERHYFRLLMETLVAEGPTVRSTLINIRTEMKEPLKMDLDTADKAIETLLDEQWLTLATSADQRRRESMNAKIQLGPRAFLELSSMLTDLGFEKDDLPQFCFYR